MEKEAENMIKLLGKLDSKNVSEIEKQLQEVLMGREYLAIDLNDLESIDLSGIFMLFMFKQNALKTYKYVTYFLDSSAVVTGNIFGINIPKII